MIKINRNMMLVCCFLFGHFDGNAETNDAVKEGLMLVPFPKSVIKCSGQLVLGDRIVSTNPALRPLAHLLCDEIKQLTGKKLSEVSDSSRAGDIVLRIEPSQKGESYTVDVQDKVIVTGGNYAAVAFGSVSLLQALTLDAGKPVVPQMSVKDEPFVSVRGLMIDAARQWHSIETLKQIVEVCRWYKIRQLQIHFTDDASFTFPSTAFPKLQTPQRHYTVEQLRDLEVFARDRGVEILPELDIPGHATAMVEQMPELFANNPKAGNVICPGKEETYRALDVLIGEMTDIFRTTPYFHIGADEVNMAPCKNCQHCQSYMARLKLDNVNELYRHFIVRMNEIVKKHGKKTIVWEGFDKDGKTDIPRDVTVMVFESLYNIAPDLVAQGYPIINTSWQPLYVVAKPNWSPEYIYGWNMYRWESWWDKSKAYGKPITITPTKLLLGAQMCAWEQPEKIEVDSIRRRLAAMSERLWNPDAKRSYQDFAARLDVTDAALTKLLKAPVRDAIAICGSAAFGELHNVAEDDFGNDGKQPHLSIGSNFTLPGNVPAEASSIVFGSPVTVNYKGLNPEAEYRLDLTFFSDGERVQKISANSEVLEEGLSLPVGSVLTKSYTFPKSVYVNGLLILNIAVMKGANAVISKAVVYSSDPKVLTVPSKEEIYQNMKIAHKSLSVARRKKVEEQVLPQVSDVLPVFHPMDPENIVLLDGQWQVETAAKKGSFQVPGQLLQQGYDVPKEEVVTFSREFSLPERFNQKNVYLRLDAMYGKAKYTLNGKGIGASERLFTPVEFDITGVVKPGVNSLRIESQLKSDSDTLACASDYAHHSLHGIPRSVRVFALPQAYLEDIAIETDLDDHYTNAILKLTLQANMDTKAAFRLKDNSNGIVLTKKLELKKGQNKYKWPVKNPAKWTAETPNLYTATFDVDGQYTVTQQIGFRTIKIDGSRILVNGQPIKLSGVNRHEVDALSGRAATAKWAEKDVALFKAANVNYVRCSHYPPTREFLDACDRFGLYVLDEAPFCWVRGEDKLVPALAQKVVDPTLAMVAHDRNHPCIIGWSLANESGSGPQDSKPIPANFIAQHHAVKKNDSSRFCVFNNEWALDSGLCEVAAMHYQGIDAADREITDRPILMDEYWHVVAYSPIHQIKDPGLRDSWGVVSQWQQIVKNDRFQGAAIWAGIDEVFEFSDGTTKGYGPWGSIADTRRRIKPEFFHVKMHYSPVWIEKPKQEDLPSGSTEVSVKIENRYSFININELKAEWEYLGKKGVAELPNIAPRSEGTLTLNTPPTRPGELLKLLFKDRGGNEIACWGILTGKRPAVQVELPCIGATAHQINQKIFIKGQDWSITLDSVSGEFSDKVGTVFTPVTLPSPFIIQSEQGFVGSISQYYGDLPDLMTRKIKSVVIGQPDAGILTLTVMEVYGTMDGTLVWKIGKNGVSTFDYDYAITENFFYVKENGGKKKVPLKQISESGLRFPLPGSYDSLAWEKPTRWGAAPDWQISRPSGKTKAHYEGNLSQTDRPWQMQETENGTADFRSTKCNVYDVSLTDGNGSGIHYAGNGEAHARAAITENGSELRLLKPEAGKKERIRGSFTVN